MKSSSENGLGKNEPPDSKGAARADSKAGATPADARASLDGQGEATPLPADEIPAALRAWERYKVEELIGVGGMGRVYRAWDPHLKRTVALKFLRGGEPQVEARFAREAQAQARVQHKNVCAVFEVGRHEGQPYIAMQYIKGPTLREAAKDLSAHDCARVMRDVSDALHAAHRQQLLHRDIKPANILLEKTDEGYVPYLTDFGLARDLEGPGVTQAGSIVGTPQYMAPEQIRGDPGRLDARTDVYGLGATLYDALAGVPPFSGTSNLQTLYRTLNDEAPPLRTRNDALPAALEAVVMKCLEKRAERRYKTARELSEDLTNWLEGKPVNARPASAIGRGLRKVWQKKALLSLLLGLALAAAVPALLALRDSGEPATLAVADFVNETHDPDLDGLSGMLITSLEQSPRLAVLTRTRMRDILRQLGKDTEARIDEPLGREVARFATADALLVPGIRRFDEVYRIELHVLDPRTNQALFTLSEEGRGKGSVPGLIDRLSRATRRKLRGKSPEGPSSVSAVTTASLEAYQHYFRGEELIERLRFREAQDELRRAIEADGGFALAYYRLGYSAMWMKDGAMALHNVEKAVQLLQRVPERERFLILALRATLTGHGAEAAAQYQQCLTRFPQEKEAAFNIGDLAFHFGRYDAALTYLKRTLELDSANERAFQHLVWTYQLMGRIPEMVDAARRYVARVGNANSYAHLGRALAAAGDVRAARAEHEKSLSRFPESSLPLADLSTLDAMEGHFAEAQARVQPLFAANRSAQDRLVALQAVAEAETYAGQVRAAATTLEEMVREALAANDPDTAVQARAMQGFTAIHLRHDLQAAQRYAERARADSLPEATLGFVYPYIGDFERYGKVLRALGDALVETEERAFRLRAGGEHAQSIADFRELSQRTPFQDILLFELGFAELQAQKFDAAAETFRRELATAPAVTSNGFGVTVSLRPRALHELGLAYEAAGQPKAALAAYEQLLKLWVNADNDLPELIDTRARAARLRGMPLQR